MRDLVREAPANGKAGPAQGEESIGHDDNQAAAKKLLTIHERVARGETCAGRLYVVRPPTDLDYTYPRSSIEDRDPNHIVVVNLIAATVLIHAAVPRFAHIDDADRYGAERAAFCAEFRRRFGI